MRTRLSVGAPKRSSIPPVFSDRLTGGMGFGLVASAAGGGSGAGGRALGTAAFEVGTAGPDPSDGAAGFGPGRGTGVALGGGGADGAAFWGAGLGGGACDRAGGNGSCGWPSGRGGLRSMPSASDRAATWGLRLGGRRSSFSAFPVGAAGAGGASGSLNTGLAWCIAGLDVPRGPRALMRIRPGRELDELRPWGLTGGTWRSIGASGLLPGPDCGRPDPRGVRGMLDLATGISFSHCFSCLVRSSLDRPSPPQRSAAVPVGAEVADAAPNPAFFASWRSSHLSRRTNRPAT